MQRLVHSGVTFAASGAVIVSAGQAGGKIAIEIS